MNCGGASAAEVLRLIERARETVRARFGVHLEMARSLAPRPGGATTPTALLVTSDEAFGMVDFFAWARDPAEPEPGTSDHRGPLVF